MSKTNADKFFVVLSVLLERTEQNEVPWELSSSSRTASRVGLGQGMIRIDRTPPSDAQSANGSASAQPFYHAFLQDMEGRVALELREDDPGLPAEAHDVLAALYRRARYSALRGDELLQSVSNALRKNEFQPVTPGTETAIEE